MLSGQITDNGGGHSFTKVGSGLVELAGMNHAWTGATTLNGGVLRLGSSSALSMGNLRFNGGILELTDTDFTRDLGTGANQAQWLGSGGFSAAHANRSVTFNGGAALTWGAGGFVPTGSALLLNSRYARGEINFTNAIDLGSELREVRVERSGASFGNSAIAKISGKLTGTGGGIEKTGKGLLWLSGSNNYTGATVIREGALRGSVSSSNIQLDGGVLGLHRPIYRQLGAAGGRIQWLGSGGFASYDDTYTVKLGDFWTNENTWGDLYFVQSGHELRFGHYTATRSIIWDSVLNFGDGMRTIRVEKGGSVTVTFNRALKNTAKTGGLRLVGDGRADLAADNVALDSDSLEISGAELRIASASARLGPVGNVAIDSGGRFTIVNAGAGAYASDQVADTTSVSLNSGELHYQGRWGDLPSVETIGDVSLEGGANTIYVARSMPAEGNAAYTELKIGTLLRSANARSILNFTSNLSSDLSYVTDGKVRFSSTESLAGHRVDGIIPWATINGSDWATTDAGNPNTLAALPAGNYTSGTTHSGHYSVAGDSSVAMGTASLDSLRLLRNSTLTLNPGAVLTLRSGGLLGWNDDKALTSANTLNGDGRITTAQGRPLYVHTYSFASGRATQIQGMVRFTGGMDLVKAGNGYLRYNSSGTSQIGSLYIHQGTVELNNGAFNTGATGQVYIGDGAGRDELRISGGTNRLASKPKVTLRGTPYGRGAEFGANEAQATLGIVSGAQQTLAELHIIDRGTIDFSGGSVAAPNRLFLDKLTFNNGLAQLFVRGWHEFEDFLLIKKTAYATPDAFKAALKQIWFDGYSLDYSLLVADYNDDYYQITPWGMMTGFPEPSTYGAILGAVGVGLWTWKKRRRRRGSLPQHGDASPLGNYSVSCD